MALTEQGLQAASSWQRQQMPVEEFAAWMYAVTDGAGQIQAEGLRVLWRLGCAYGWEMRAAHAEEQAQVYQGQDAIWFALSWQRSAVEMVGYALDAWEDVEALVSQWGASPMVAWVAARKEQLVAARVACCQQVVQWCAQWQCGQPQWVLDAVVLASSVPEQAVWHLSAFE